jgi:hypothetical protein
MNQFVRFATTIARERSAIGGLIGPRSLKLYPFSRRLAISRSTDFELTPDESDDLNVQPKADLLFPARFIRFVCSVFFEQRPGLYWLLG